MDCHPSPEAALQRWYNDGQPRALLYKELGLVVKVKRVRFDEVLAMCFMRRTLPTVPVPQVYAWHVRDEVNLLYMSLAPGTDLDSAWLTLTFEEKRAICAELASMIEAMRSLPHPGAIRSIVGPVRDIFFESSDDNGFETMASFHDMLSNIAIPPSLRDEGFVDPYRAMMSNDYRICFSHADLHPGNIFVSGAVGSRRISGILDWEQAGWYPEYWEYCKMHLTWHYDHEWRSAGWVNSTIQPYESEFQILGEYWQCRPP